MSAKHQHYGTGRRKTSIARVFLSFPGTGKISVNGKTLENYFPLETARMIILQALEVVNMLNQVDLYITVKGGGCSSQAGAVRHGLARALVDFDEAGMDKNAIPAGVDNEQDNGDNAAAPALPPSFRQLLRREGMLTRDPRMVERKKVGLKKARKRPQYSKR